MKWITKGLKNLGVGSGTVPPALLQSRLAGTQAATTIPPKPKRPMTAYFRFLNEVRPDVVKKNPNLKPPELMKVVGQRWTQLDSQTKEKYSQGFKNEIEAYQTVMEKYMKSLTPEQRAAQEQLKISKQLRKEKLEKRRRVADSGRPKRPASPFLQFLQSKVAPGSSMKEHTATAQKFGPIWKEMSDEEKAPFVTKYAKQIQDYEKVLVKWENEMIKLGNDDLVRSKTLDKSKDHHGVSRK